MPRNLPANRFLTHARVVATLRFMRPFSSKKLPPIPGSLKHFGDTLHNLERVVHVVMQPSLNKFAEKKDIDVLKNNIDLLSKKMDTKAEKSGLEALSKKMDTKAEKSDLEALSKKMDTKAEKSDLEALSKRMDEKFEKVDAKLEKVDVKLNELALTFHKELRSHLQATIGIILGFAGFFVASQRMGFLDKPATATNSSSTTPPEIAPGLPVKQ